MAEVFMSKSRLLRIAATLGLLVAFSGWALAQSSGSQSAPDNSSQNPPSTQNPPSNNTQNPPPDNSTQNKKKKKKDSPQDVLNSEVFSDAVAKSVLNDIRDGLEGHSPRLMESAFDADKMDGYLMFEDQLEAMFQRYSEFRVHFTLSQNSVEGSKGVILVDIEMEEVPNSTGKNTNPQPLRKNGQVRFVLERGKKGWKIVDFDPRSFFS
jgi:hypothetical protein